MEAKEFNSEKINKENTNKKFDIKNFNLDDFTMEELVGDFCPICHNKMIPYDSKRMAGRHCSKCDYGYVAYMAEPWEEDSTEYSVFFKAKDTLPFEKLKFIAKKCGTSCIKVKSALANGNLFYTKGMAYELKDDIIKMNELGIDYEIIPEFKYNFDDE